jgi:hypothetical protein
MTSSAPPRNAEVWATLFMALQLLTSSFWVISRGCSVVNESRCRYTHTNSVNFLEHARSRELNWQPVSRRHDHCLRDSPLIGRRHAVPPYRARPSWIANGARDDMQVKLTNDVAKRADINLVRPCVRLRNRAAQPASSITCVCSARARSLTSTRPSRRGTRMSHGPAGVVHQQHTAYSKSPMTNVSLASRPSRVNVIASRHARGARPAVQA